MLNFRKSLKSNIAAALVAITAFGAVAPTVAMAQDHHDDRGRHEDRGRGPGRGPEWRGDRHFEGGPGRSVMVRPRPMYYRPYLVPRTRFYQNVRVYRPYGLLYPGFGFYYRDSDAFRFLGLTAMSLVVFNQLNEAEQRAHEEAFIEATSAPIGQPIIWNQDGQSGAVTPVRDGTTPDGRQCREFQQDVTIGGDKTEAYGTACMQPDGSWQVVDNQ